MNNCTKLGAALLIALSPLVTAEAKPLRVYILAGQSNMEGQGAHRTFDYIGDDPATAPLLEEMLGPDGRPRVCEKVWISYNATRSGKLDAGYGGACVAGKAGDRIGSEFKGNVIAVPTAPYWDETLEPLYWKNRKLSEMHGRPAGEIAEYPGEELFSRGRGPVEARRFQRRLPLPRQRQDFRADRQGLCRGVAGDGEEMSRFNLQILRAILFSGIGGSGVSAADPATPRHTNVCVYGGTASGVMAAAAAAKEGADVIVGVLPALPSLSMTEMVLRHAGFWLSLLGASPPVKGQGLPHKLFQAIDHGNLKFRGVCHGEIECHNRCFYQFSGGKPDTDENLQNFYSRPVES